MTKASQDDIGDVTQILSNQKILMEREGVTPTGADLFMLISPECMDMPLFMIHTFARQRYEIQKSRLKHFLRQLDLFGVVRHQSFSWVLTDFGRKVYARLAANRALTLDI